MSNCQQKRDSVAEQEENADNSSDLLIQTCSSSSRSHYTPSSNGTQGSQPNKKTSTEKDVNEHMKELYAENEKLRVENQNLHYKLLIHETKNLQKEKQKLLSEINNPVTIRHYTPSSNGTQEDISLDEDISDVLFFSTSNDEKMMAVVLRSYDEKNNEDNIVIKTFQLSNFQWIKTITKSLDEYDFGYALGMTKIDGVDVIASAHELNNREVKFWNINNFQEVASFECSDQVFTLAPFTENGKIMVACGLFGGKSIELWDVQSKKRVHTSENRERWTRLLHTFQYDKKLYLLCNYLNLWCLDDENKLVKTLSNEKNVCSLTTVEFGGDVLIFASGDGKIMSWRMSNLEVYHEFNFESNLFHMKPFMSNEKIFLASVKSEKGSFCVVDVKEKKLVHEVKYEDYKFSSLDLYEEDRDVVFITFDYDKKGLVFFKGHNMQAL